VSRELAEQLINAGSAEALVRDQPAVLRWETVSALKTEVDRLIGSDLTYSIFADNVNLGSITAQSGYLKVEFTSDGSSGRVLPSALRPVTGIKNIELRNPAGQVVLLGVFQAGGGPAVVGAQVEVKGTARSDGSTNATRIEVRR